MIPLFRPSCTDLEVKYVTEVLRSGWWDQGSKVEELEEKFAERVGVKHAIAMNSATMALQLTVQALGIDHGEIIMPALTFPSTGLAALHNGCDVVFADVDRDTLCIDWDDVKRKITARTKAIIPVWYGGSVPPVTNYCKHFPPIIEDCAHAAGSLHAGFNGVAACWSFQTKKNIASGDGGMVTTNDGELAARLRRLRWCGISRSTYDRDKSGYSWEYDIREPGWKAHMNDITAAIALAQLERLDETNAARKKIVCRYLDELKDLDWLVDTNWLELPRRDEGSAWHLFPVRVERQRDDFIEHMLSCGVSAGVHYKPLSNYWIFTPYGKPDLPVTDEVWKTLVTLPLYPDMTDEDVSRVIGAVRSFR